MTPAWQSTVPANSSPPIGHVDWVAANGMPRRATLHENGQWSSTVAEFAQYLNAFWSPRDTVAAPEGLAELLRLSRKKHGKLTITRATVALALIHAVPSGEEEEFTDGGR